MVSAAIALVEVFLPGILVLVGTLPFWEALRRKRAAQAALREINAAVVAILAAALYDPVWTSAVVSLFDLAIAAIGFMALVRSAAPPRAVVVGTVAASATAGIFA